MIPIHTSIQPRRTPYANYALIAANILIYLLTYVEPYRTYTGQIAVLRPFANHFILTPGHLTYYQFITYAFLHGGLAHIIGNMLFLYIFGNNVNDKMGTAGYLAFYAAGAVASGFGHLIFSNSPVLGASGAVAAVTGAYLVLFPRTLITVVYWFIFIGTFELPAIFFIGVKLIFIDNIIAANTPMVAYDAHLAGYAFGIALLLFLLATGLIKGNYDDLYFMLVQWNRRRKYRDTTAEGYDPFKAPLRRKKVTVKQVKKSPERTKRDNKINELRTKTVTLITNKNLPEAAQTYLEIVNIDKDHFLPRNHQLDIANQLMSMGKWQESANAYEKFLEHYKKYEYIEQVQLMLGVLYARYLEKNEEAVKYLTLAKEKLTNPEQLKMCRDELERIKSK